MNHEIANWYLWWPTHADRSPGTEYMGKVDSRICRKHQKYLDTTFQLHWIWIIVTFRIVWSWVHSQNQYACWERRFHLKVLAESFPSWVQFCEVIQSGWINCNGIYFSSQEKIAYFLTQQAVHLFVHFKFLRVWRKGASARISSTARQQCAIS